MRNRDRYKFLDGPTDGMADFFEGMLEWDQSTFDSACNILYHEGRVSEKFIETVSRCYEQIQQLKEGCDEALQDVQAGE
jgi:hypothetical protein